MTNKRVRMSLLILTTLTMASVWGHQFASLAGNGMITATGKKSLKLVAEYKKNSLEDVSEDGRLLLFYQTSMPMRSYTIPVDGSRGRANQREVYDDVLRVAERDGAREIGRISTSSFPYRARFIPGTQQVFYSEQKEVSKPGVLQKLWNPTSPQALTCLDARNETFSNTTAVSPQKAMAALWQESNGGELLVSLTLPNCDRTIISSVNPSDPTARMWGGSEFAFSPSRHHMAYGTADKVIIRNTATLEVVDQLKAPSGLFFASDPQFIPSGLALIIFANDKINPTITGTRHYLLFYDTTNYEPVRRLEMEPGTTMAVSPDSRLLAVGYTKEDKNAFAVTERPLIVLYDLSTGQEVATASHPPIKQRRSDPFAAKISRLVFTPDGKYLLSSTYDTRVWQIENRNSN
jgi:hypothetical protein